MFSNVIVTSVIFYMLEEFGLTLEQTRIMFSLEYQLVNSDRQAERDLDKSIVKAEWLLEWKNSTELFLQNETKKENHPLYIDSLITNWSTLKEEIGKKREEIGNKLTFYLILLEAVVFTPYYPLGVSQDEKFKNLKISDQQKTNSQLELIATTLGINKDCVSRFESDYQNAINGISGKGLQVLLGAVVGTVILAVATAFFTPAIAYFLAPILAPGLSGAAAISAVLAALGGGAIAVGGFGMAGGFAVLVAGGAILGAGAGVGVGSLFAQSPDTALTQAAKLEVIMKEIVFIQKDILLAQNIIKEQRSAIRSLEDQLDDLIVDKEKNSVKIKNLIKAIDYLKKALQRNRDLL